MSIISKDTAQSLAIALTSNPKANEVVNTLNKADALWTQSAKMLAASIVATSVSPTTDFGALKVGDQVIHIPAVLGPADMQIIAPAAAAVAADATLDLTADIALASVATGASRNTNTFTVQVLAADANPTDTVLVAFTGTAAAIVCTVTPNDGTNNSLTPVDLTTAELVELINTGAVVGKTVTLADASSRRILQTATGGDTTVLADSGEGDGVVATFANGADAVVIGLQEAAVIGDLYVVLRDVTAPTASNIIL